MDKDSVLDALRQVIDPEIGINVVDLGLVYGVECPDGVIRVDLTMTTAACPLGSYITDQATGMLKKAFPEADITVNLVWDPPWTPERMSPETRKQLGWD